MPFRTAARRLLGTLPPGTGEHAILDFLLSNAAGAGNAKSWDAIETHCAGIAVTVDKLVFQQGFLAQTRDGDVFIGACPKGYFIIQNRDDALVAADFYRARIAREQEHLTHLQDLVMRAGWPAI